MVTRLSASVAFEAGIVVTATSTFLPFSDFLTGADPPPGMDITFQRSVVLSSLNARAVKTWVTSGWGGATGGTGTSNTGSKPLRTNSLPSLRLMKTETGPGLSGRSSSTVVLVAVLATRDLPA